jgi:hypothetical protein
MAHTKPWMASLLAIGLRTSPELHKEHPETFTGTIKVIGRVERGQDRISDDAVVAVMVIEYVNDPSASGGIQAARLTCTLVRQSGDWLIAQAHASPAS